MIGAGIAGLSAALDLADLGCSVTVFDAAPTTGGRIVTSPFAGLEHVDEGADAVLARVPDAIELAARLGMTDELVAPEPVGAAVWHEGLHAIPDGLVLGLPGRVGPLVRTRLLSTRGKLRAGLDLIAPRTSTASDSIGDFVRSRFGDEVHERLVDALVGSIYATDTDNFSLDEVPQLAALARSNRSVLLAARRHLWANRLAGTAAAGAEPVFAAPRRGLGSLTDNAAAAVRRHGGDIRTACSVGEVRRNPTDGRIVVGGASFGDEVFDAIVIAAPALAAADVLRSAAPDAADLLETAETADVIMVTLHLPERPWPDRIRSLSGYLVPKPDQRLVTAVSFGSQKWAHWRPPGGGHVVRVSLGRDGRHVLDLDDASVLDGVIGDLEHHLGFQPSPLDTRVTRWPGAFAQYRPHHADWVAQVEGSLPAGVFVAGASYHGIGIPACIRSGRAAVGRMADCLLDVPD